MRTNDQISERIAEIDELLNTNQDLLSAPTEREKVALNTEKELLNELLTTRRFKEEQRERADRLQREAYTKNQMIGKMVDATGDDVYVGISRQDAIQLLVENEAPDLDDLYDSVALREILQSEWEVEVKFVYTDTFLVTALSESEAMEKAEEQARDWSPGTYDEPVDYTVEDAWEI